MIGFNHGMMFFVVTSQSDNGKGVLSVEHAISFLLSVLAGIAANYITQWLQDRHKRNGDNK